MIMIQKRKVLLPLNSKHGNDASTPLPPQFKGLSSCTTGRLNLGRLPNWHLGSPRHETGLWKSGPGRVRSSRSISQFHRCLLRMIYILTFSLVLLLHTHKHSP